MDQPAATVDYHIYSGDALDQYSLWPSPTVIISDGAYGIGGFPGDPPTPETLASWYEPHIAAWSTYATPQTTLWFWNTEIGWAITHPILVKYGWEYRACHIWDKGISHAAGNSNTQSLRKLPIVTEICVQYIKKPIFVVDGQPMTAQTWLRYEWQRTKLPFSKTNEACGVKNAATRKYFTSDHLWYFPPAQAFQRIVDYANQWGDKSGLPYFSVDGKTPLTESEWEKYRAKFYCPVGVTNVWREPALNGQERLKRNGKARHLNQKPLKLMELIISLSSDPGDIIWEPFGGLCTATLAASQIGRIGYAAEQDEKIYELAIERFQHLPLRRLL